MTEYPCILFHRSKDGDFVVHVRYVADGETEPRLAFVGGYDWSMAEYIPQLAPGDSLMAPLYDGDDMWKVLEAKKDALHEKP